MAIEWLLSGYCERRYRALVGKASLQQFIVLAMLATFLKVPTFRCSQPLTANSHCICLKFELVKLPGQRKAERRSLFKNVGCDSGEDGKKLFS